MEIIIIIYFVALFVLLVWIAYVYSRDKNSYMKVACSRLLSTIKCMNDELNNLDVEIEKLYMGYSNSVPSVKKVYPNVVVWLEDIVYRINGDFKYARKLKPYIKDIKSARNALCKKYPFSDCEKYQQEILGDLKKLENMDEKLDNSIVIDNLIARIKGEFFRLNNETSKNNKLNFISAFITIISIIVTILSLF